MNKDEYRALVTEESEGRFISSVKTCRISALPGGELLVRVHYSSLNYKDALSAGGNRGVTRNYPHTPGIDAAGIVEKSDVPDFKKGDEVLITGWDFGMNTAGGFGEYVRIPSSWALKLPAGLTMKESMILGTAGLTAGLSVYRLSQQVKPDSGLVAVSGATGGVGSLSLAILSAGGYRSAAITRKLEQADYLKNLGAAEIIPVNEMDDERPMLQARFSGGIDSVGGVVLQTMLKSVKPLGLVTCCGNAASASLEMTVYPFILRGISLIGIDSQNCPGSIREKIWGKLSGEWKPSKMMDIYKEISLEDLPSSIEMMLGGRMRGRVIIRHRI